MRAMVLKGHGGPDSLVYDESFPDPECGKNDVVVRVKATSLNYHDIFTRNGMPGIKIEMPMICGLDVAGEIAEVGDEVSGWSRGDRVLIDPRNRVEGGLVGETIHGGLAEYCRVASHQLVKIPAGVTYDQASSLPVAYGTAHRMMVTIGKIKNDEKVLILGASGGVGTGALLLAKMAGSEVMVCASSEEKMERLKDLGADHAITYMDNQFHKGVYERFGKPGRRGFEGGVNMVVNFTGGETWVPSLRSLKRGGRLVTCGATAGFDPKTDIRFIWTFELQLLGSNSWEREDLTQLMDYIDGGKMNPVIDKILPLKDASEGIRLLEEREVFGKVIINP
ncbi:zinc-binding dehydrogenase [Rhodospirillaceae bacterium]|nr:zinc-binding dehydrogenase [Rhodospirillaceae bacterium]MBT7732522.1 zinc-binding dehydrogenase [Rhodospirillaceae bacterium]MDC0998093.1 zinc-binding dehydrogenase [Alphaproteobacteria bacterium]MDC1442589.1 zinc-binding dehydrogenase [Rhodospirillaceae bacterium]